MQSRRCEVRSETCILGLLAPHTPAAAACRCARAGRRRRRARRSGPAAAADGRAAPSERPGAWRSCRASACDRSDVQPLGGPEAWVRAPCVHGISGLSWPLRKLPARGSLRYGRMHELRPLYAARPVILLLLKLASLRRSRLSWGVALAVLAQQSAAAPCAGCWQRRWGARTRRCPPRRRPTAA